MSFPHYFASVVCHPLTFHILIFSRTTRLNWSKLRCDTLWMLLFQNYVRWPCLILKMAAMASDWLKNWKSLKIFFRITGWIETKFSQNAGTAHPLEQMRAPSNQIIVFTQLQIFKLQSVMSCNSNWFNWILYKYILLGHTKLISWFSGPPACGNSSPHCRFFCKNSKKKNLNAVALSVRKKQPHPFFSYIAWSVKRFKTHHA